MKSVKPWKQNVRLREPRAHHMLCDECRGVVDLRNGDGLCGYCRGDATPAYGVPAERNTKEKDNILATMH